MTLVRYPPLLAMAFFVGGQLFLVEEDRRHLSSARTHQGAGLTRARFNIGC